MNSKEFHIAVIVEMSRYYGREVTRGISSMAAERPNWHIYQQERRLHERLPARLKAWQGDGILFHAHSRRLVQAILKLGIPAVSLTTLPKGWIPPKATLPMFGINPEDVANMAADFFLRGGFRNFVFCGFADQQFSGNREAAFVRRLQDEGYGCHSILLNEADGSDSFDDSVDSAEEGTPLATLLKGLPPETALLACNDDAARRVIYTCREQGIRVPDDLAVMGVDNDPVICGMLTPNITSIDADPFRIGYAAAWKLDQILRTGQGGDYLQLLAPRRVVERASTDVVIARDQLVRDAVRLIQSEARTGLTAKALVARLGVSRTTLENRFRSELHRTIHDLILDRRLETAQRLLEDTELPQTVISTRSGFLDVSHFSRTFRKRLGTTPGEHRRCYAVRQGA